MKRRQNSPDEKANHVIKLYQDDPGDDGLNCARGLMTVAAFWIMLGITLLLVVYVTFELARKH